MFREDSRQAPKSAENLKFAIALVGSTLLAACGGSAGGVTASAEPVIEGQDWGLANGRSVKVDFEGGSVELPTSTGTRTVNVKSGTRDVAVGTHDWEVFVRDLEQYCSGEVVSGVFKNSNYFDPASWSYLITRSCQVGNNGQLANPLPAAVQTKIFGGPYQCLAGGIMGQELAPASACFGNLVTQVAARTKCPDGCDLGGGEVVSAFGYSSYSAPTGEDVGAWVSAYNLVMGRMCVGLTAMTMAEAVAPVRAWAEDGPQPDSLDIRVGDVSLVSSSLTNDTRDASDARWTVPVPDSESSATLYLFAAEQFRQAVTAASSMLNDSTCNLVLGWLIPTDSQISAIRAGATDITLNDGQPRGYDLLTRTALESLMNMQEAAEKAQKQAAAGAAAKWSKEADLSLANVQAWRNGHDSRLEGATVFGAIPSTAFENRAFGGTKTKREGWWPVVKSIALSSGDKRAEELLRATRVVPCTDPDRTPETGGICANRILGWTQLGGRTVDDVANDLVLAMQQDYPGSFNMTGLAFLESIGVTREELARAGSRIMEENEVLGRVIAVDGNTTAMPVRTYGTAKNVRPVDPAYLYARSFGTLDEADFANRSGGYTNAVWGTDIARGPSAVWVLSYLDTHDYAYANTGVYPAIEWFKRVAAKLSTNPKLSASSVEALERSIGWANLFVDGHAVVVGRTDSSGFGRVEIRLPGLGIQNLTQLQDEVDLWVGEAGLECYRYNTVAGRPCLDPSAYKLSEASWAYASSTGILVVTASPDKRLYVSRTVGTNRKVLLGIDAIGSSFSGEYTARKLPLLGEAIEQSLTESLAADPLDPSGVAVNCAGLPRNMKIKLEDELVTNTANSETESSFADYLKKARDAADRADDLGDTLVEKGLSMDLRMEEARDALEEKCGGVLNVGALNGADCANSSACTLEELVKKVRATSPDTKGLEQCLGYSQDSNATSVALGAKSLCMWRFTSGSTPLDYCTCSGASCPPKCALDSDAPCLPCKVPVDDGVAVDDATCKPVLCGEWADAAQNSCLRGGGTASACATTRSTTLTACTGNASFGGTFVPGIGTETIVTEPAAPENPASTFCRDLIDSRIKGSTKPALPWDQQTFKTLASRIGLLRDYLGNVTITLDGGVWIQTGQIDGSKLLLADDQNAWPCKEPMAAEKAYLACKKAPPATDLQGRPLQAADVDAYCAQTSGFDGTGLNGAALDLLKSCEDEFYWGRRPIFCGLDKGENACMGRDPANRMDREVENPSGFGIDRGANAYHQSSGEERLSRAVELIKILGGGDFSNFEVRSTGNGLGGSFMLIDPSASSEPAPDAIVAVDRTGVPGTVEAAEILFTDRGFRKDICDKGPSDDPRRACHHGFTVDEESMVRRYCVPDADMLNGNGQARFWGELPNCGSGEYLWIMDAGKLKTADRNRSWPRAHEEDLVRLWTPGRDEYIGKIIELGHRYAGSYSDLLSHDPERIVFKPEDKVGKQPTYYDVGDNDWVHFNGNDSYAVIPNARWRNGLANFDEHDLLDALELSCLATDPGVLSPALPEVTALKLFGLDDYPARRRELLALASAVESQLDEMVLHDVPQRLVQDLKEGLPTGTFPGFEGEYGATVAELAGALRVIPEQSKHIAQLVRDAAAAMGLAESRLEVIEISKELSSLRAAARIAEYNNQCVTGMLGAMRTGGDIVSAVLGGLGKMGMALMQCAGLSTQKEFVRDIQSDEVRLASEQGKQVLIELSNQLSGITTQVQTAQLELQKAYADLNRLSIELKRHRAGAQRALAKMLMLSTDAFGRQYAVNTAMRARLNTLRVRYERSHQGAIRMAYVARRAIEQKLGVNMSFMSDDMSLVESPRSWVDEICTLRGINYDEIRDESERDDNGTFVDPENYDYANSYVGDYVTKLENFLDSYRLDYPFQDGSDVAVVSLRDELLSVEGDDESACFEPGDNQLLHTVNMRGEPKAGAPGWSRIKGANGSKLTIVPTAGPFTSLASADRGVFSGDESRRAGEVTAVSLSRGTSAGTELPRFDNLLVWARADSCDSGVSSCQDLATGGTALRQEWADSRPTVVSGIGGKPSWLFESSDRFDVVSEASPTNYTVLVVAQPSGAPYQALLGRRYPDVPTPQPGLGLLLSQGNLEVRQGQTDSPTALVPNPTAAHVYGVRVSGTSRELLLDGTSVEGDALGVPTSLRAHIGSDYDSERGFTGQIAEVMVFGKALSDEELATAQAYFNRRYFEQSEPVADVVRSSPRYEQTVQLEPGWYWLTWYQRVFDNARNQQGTIVADRVYPSAMVHVSTETPGDVQTLGPNGVAFPMSGPFWFNESDVGAGLSFWSAACSLTDEKLPMSRQDCVDDPTFERGLDGDWMHLRTVFIVNRKTEVTIGFSLDSLPVDEWNSVAPSGFRFGEAVSSLSSTAIAAPQLERITDMNDPVPHTFYPTAGTNLTWVGGCADEDGSRFRSNVYWTHGCEVYCPPGTGTRCTAGGTEGLPQRCYKEARFQIAQEEIESGKLIPHGGFAKGNFNYRFDQIAVNVVGAQIKNCAISPTPEACNANYFVQYTLRHDGPYRVRNYDGDIYDAPLFEGRIQQAKALAAERYLTNPFSSADRNLSKDYFRSEFQGRPLDGHYRLRIYEPENLNWNQLEDIQIVLKYKYWTRAD